MDFKSQGYCFILYWAILTTEIKDGDSLRSFVVKLVLRARDTILVYYSLGHWDATNTFADAAYTSVTKKSPDP